MTTEGAGQFKPPRNLRSDPDLAPPADPAERDDAIILSARRLLVLLGVDTKSEGMLDTPRRMVKALRELTEGLSQSADDILSRTFTEACDELIIIKDVPFVSLCEHHMMPFEGTCTIGYLPQHGSVVGLSKLPRLVHCFARRPQVQERLTRQIAETILRVVDPLFVGVIVRAQHSCMRLRGVQSDGVMLTSCILPAAQRTTTLKDEFLRLAL